MKAISVFLTFILVLAGLDLCKDYEVVNDHKETIELAKNGGENQRETDVCSPFCHCIRCPFSAQIAQKVLPASYFQLLYRFYPSTIEGNPIQFSTSVWQPPKLG